ncbi:hypothetical protein GWQ22_21705, partial [Aeromonas sp. 1HA1]|nr:hypothetical protein [Aeromonas sp. 1HA1]
MKTTPENLTPLPELSSLGAAELLVVIAGFQQKLALQEDVIQSKEEALRAKDAAIARRDAHILL